jgi:hypothetical protein
LVPTLESSITPGSSSGLLVTMETTPPVAAAVGLSTSVVPWLTEAEPITSESATWLVKMA